MKAGEFSRRKTAFLVIAIGASFIFTLFAIIYLGDKAVPTAQPSAFSKSSIGHELMVETLRELDFDVRINRRRPPGMEIKGDLLIIAEPNLKDLPDRHDLELAIQWAGAVLVVLPKRTGNEDPDDHDKLVSVDDSAIVEPVLDLFIPNAAIVAFKNSGEVSWTENNWNISPTIEDMNLVVSDDLHPLIATKDGVLLGRDLFYHENLYVLSDPDLLATHGFVKGSNAELAVAIIHDILPPGGAIFIDESSHGYVLSDSFWQEMFRYPLSLIMVHGILCLFILIWLTSGRLGKKKPSLPAIPPGKQFLLENVVGLMSYFRHDGFMAEQYLRMTIRNTALALRIRGSDEEIEDRLSVVSQSKNIPYDPGAWREEIRDTEGTRPSRQRKLLKVVQQANQWRKEILDES